MRATMLKTFEDGIMGFKEIGKIQEFVTYAETNQMSMCLTEEDIQELKNLAALEIAVLQEPASADANPFSVLAEE